MSVDAGLIKRLRKERGLTQQEAAKGVGVSIKTIYRYEHGMVKRYHLPTISKFEIFFEVTEADIWKENDYEEK